VPALPGHDPLSRFRALIAARLGLSFEPSRLSGLSEVLERRAGERALDVASYVGQLEVGLEPLGLAELARDLTVSETYFFRHVQQFDALRAIVTKNQGRAAGSWPSLLSAGCASGEEAYSLAIALRETSPDRMPSVLAIDVNPSAFNRGRAGRFSAWSLRETPEPTRTRWFREDGRFFELDPSIRDCVRFREANLVVDDPIAFQPNAYDVIFCRNVLMYFTASQSRDAVARLYRALVPGGYLFLGSAETLRGTSHDFELCQEHGAFYYQKKPIRAAKRGELATDSSEPGWASPRATTSEQDGATERNHTQENTVAISRGDEAGGRWPASGDPPWAVVIARASARVVELSSPQHERSPEPMNPVGSSRAVVEPPANDTGPIGLRSDLRESLEM